MRGGCEAFGDMGAEAGGAMGKGGGGEAGSALGGEGGDGGWSTGKEIAWDCQILFSFFIRKRVWDDDLCRNGPYTLCTMPRHI